jgi:tetratricopeptide (TPR) repeat protein
MKKGKYLRGTLLSDSPTLQAAVAGMESPLTDSSVPLWKRWMPIVLIMILTAFVYSFSLDNQATNWDDDKYTEQNPLLKSLDKETVTRMFASDDPTELYFMGNYHPLTMLTLNIDYHYSDLMANGKAEPIRFIVVNIMLHILACMMVYLVFSQLFTRRLYPIVIALLFGIHTLHVESVSWISERKDVLYTMFYFMSLYCYILYKKRSDVKFYILSLFIFILSSLSKGQAVSLTITLFLVDYMISEDYLKLKSHLNKIPFFVISLVFGFISIKAQSHSTALSETDQYEIYQRIAFGSNGFLQYILRFILPINLANLYPYPDIINRTVPVVYWLTVPVFVFLLVVNLFIYNKNKILTFGLMFYIVNIALLLQFIPVGSAMYSDRYSYIPSVGLSVLIAYLIDLGIEKYSKSRTLFYIIFSMYSLLLCYLTINREKVWHDSISLWSDCVEKYPEAVIGWNNLGSQYNVLADSIYKKTDDSKFLEYKQKAIDCFSNGIKYKPDYVNCFYNRGLAQHDLYEFHKDTAYNNKALKDFNSAILFNLNYAPAYQNRAIIYDSRADEFMGVNKDSAAFYTNLAISDYNRALDLDSTLVDCYMNRGTTYGKSGNYRRALQDFDIYHQKKPNNPSLYSNYGLAHSGLKMYDEAIKDFEKSLELDPQSETTYFNRSITYRMLGDSLSDKKYYKLAADDLTKCIEISPNKPSYRFLRGVCYHLVGNRGEACDDFTDALNMNYTEAEYFVKNFCKGNK